MLDGSRKWIILKLIMMTFGAYQLQLALNMTLMDCNGMWNAVAFGKSKGKGEPKGYQSKGYQPSSAKGSKGFDEGKSGKD